MSHLPGSRFEIQRVISIQIRLCLQNFPGSVTDDINLQFCISDIYTGHFSGNNDLFSLLIKFFSDRCRYRELGIHGQRKHI